MTWRHHPAADRSATGPVLHRGAEAEFGGPGKLTSIARPPPGRARAPWRRRGRWRWPGRWTGRGRGRRLWWVRRADSRWKGWKSRSTSAGGMTGPLLVTERSARPSLTAVVTSTCPPGTLWPNGVVDQVGHQPFGRSGSPSRTAGWVRPRRAVPGGRPRRGGQQDLAGDGRQVDGLAAVEAALAAGQGEQRLDEALLFGVGGEYVPGRSPATSRRWCRGRRARPAAWCARG